MGGWVWAAALWLWVINAELIVAKRARGAEKWGSEENNDLALKIFIMARCLSDI